MLSFLHPSLPRSRVSNGSLMGDYVWDPFTRQYNSSVAFLLLFLICLRSILHTAALSNTVMIISSSLPHPDFSVAPFLPLRLLFNCWVVSDSLQPHELQHTRLPCPSLSSRVCSNSCPLSQWCHLTISSTVSLFSSCLNLSQHQSLFQWIGSLHQVAKVLELQLSISPSSEYSGLISFRTDWFNLLTVQRTLKSLLQHHSLKASVLQCSAFFVVVTSLE